MDELLGTVADIEIRNNGHYIGFYYKGNNIGFTWEEVLRIKTLVASCQSEETKVVGIVASVDILASKTRVSMLFAGIRYEFTQEEFYYVLLLIANAKGEVSV